MAVLRSRRPEPRWVDLRPLDEADVRQIVVSHLREYCKELDREPIETICQMDQARNPLYLLVMLNELRTLGGNDMNRIVPQLIAEMKRKHPDAVSLFDWVLERLEVFGREPVRLWCSYLASGRAGMASRELSDLLVRRLGPDAARTALLIERGLRRYLQCRGPQLDFFHSQFREAVRKRYLSEEFDRVRAHSDIAAYFGTRWREPHLHALADLPYHQIRAARWDELEATLTDIFFLEGKTTAGLVFDLAIDFSAAVAGLPPERPQSRIVRLLDEALRRDIHFIARHAPDYPQALFQCLWNSCWWYDSAVAADHYVVPEDGWPSGEPPWDQPGPKLSALLERWRAEKEQMAPRFPWVRSSRPPATHLGTALRAVFRGHEERVTSVAFSPDGRRIVSGSWQQTRVWEAETGTCLEVIQGEGDVAAIAGGAALFPWRLMGRRDESVVESAVDGRVVALSPTPLERIATHPSGRRWAGASGDHMHLLQLEGLAVNDECRMTDQ
jgi:hypothetical protein